MVEVFKTNVSNCDDAESLIQQIHKNFKDYQANFDLDDCDLILRVACANRLVETSRIIELLKLNGFTAEILLDDFEPTVDPTSQFFIC